MVRNKFDEQIEDLNEELIDMGNLVNSRIDQSIKALIDGDTESANFIIKNDDDINDMEKSIEKKALRLILRQQPVAKDLRFISSTLKMITDLERIGDHAVDISELTLRIIKLKGRTLSDDLISMANLAMEMVNESIRAFINSDLEVVENIKNHDDKVDAYFDKIKNGIINDIRNDLGNPEVSVDFLMIAKYLERIGDHAENISEWVTFSITGEQA